MTDAEQRKAAKKFVADWKNKGYEKGESQIKKSRSSKRISLEKPKSRDAKNIRNSYKVSCDEYPKRCIYCDTAGVFRTKEIHTNGIYERWCFMQ